MIVISDTTPIISLLKCGNLDLLQKLYTTVLIPSAVYKELTENPFFEDEVEIIKSSDFLKIHNVDNFKEVEVLRATTGLDAGESEALVLYDEAKADLLLMDERRGRKIAQKLNIRIIGTVGILMLAFDKKFLSSGEVKNCLKTMADNNIRLDEKLYNVVMARMGAV